MTIRQQWGVVGLVLLLLGGGLAAATRYLGDELFPVAVGSTAPDFQARTLGTPPRVKTLRDYRGQVVLLNIWATWCPPCRQEMPSIERLYQAYGPRGLRVVAVSVDDAGQQRTIRDFVRQYALTFEILHDPAGSVQRAYQTTGIPETFIIGRDGLIRKKQIGAADWNSPDVRALITELLAEPAP